MVDVIDQTWVPEWTQRIATREESLTMKKWLKEAPSEWHPVLKKLPPLCVVRGTRDVEVPFPFSVGFVAGYLDTGEVLVQQEPTKSAVPCSPEKLTPVGWWRGMTPEVVQRILR